MNAAFDNGVVVAGVGPVGLAVAVALTREGARVTLVGRPAPVAAGRTVALFADSARLLSELGAWEALAPRAATLRKLRIIDDTDNLFRWRPLTFEASEIGLDAFGWNIEAGELTRALRQVVDAAPAICSVDGFAEQPSFVGDHASVLVEGHGRLEAALIVAADGQRSPLRQAAGIEARLEPLPQSALTAILAHDAPHDDISTEFHTRGGPCTLVPLRDRTSSLVWMMRRAEARRLQALDDDAFAREVEGRVRSILGAMRVIGPRGAIPLASLDVKRLAGPRLALVGEAAHAFPPIGAQGLNLGLRDVAALAALMGKALRGGRDIGAPALMEAYDRSRKLDVAGRKTGVSLMNRSLLSPFPPADLARGVGMAALDLIGPLRRLVMREGVAPGFGGRTYGDSRRP